MKKGYKFWIYWVCKLLDCKNLIVKKAYVLIKVNAVNMIILVVNVRKDFILKIVLLMIIGSIRGIISWRIAY